LIKLANGAPMLEHKWHQFQT